MDKSEALRHLVGVGTAEFKDNFSAAAAQYARFRPGYPAALVDFLASVAPSDVLAWDAGCGNGQFSLPLAARFKRVIATDASAEQIGSATPHARVEYRVAPGEASGIESQSVSLATVAQAAHWFDLPAYYREVERVAVPGAAVALFCYGRMFTDEAVGEAVDRFYASEPLASHWPPERAIVEDGYRSLPFPFEPIVAPDFALKAQWTLEQTVGYVQTWSSVTRLVRAEGRAHVDRFLEDMSRAWGDPSTQRTMHWPLGLRLGRIHA